MAVNFNSAPYTTAGQVLTSTSNGTSWTYATPQTNFTNSNGTAVMSIPYGEDKIVVEEKATLDVKGTVVINGVNLEERLSVIEQVLNIPTRDVIMETKYPKLAKLYQQYMHELEKYRTWDRIKGESK